MTDAAFPPGPAELVTDCHAIGAAGAFVYVWGGFTNYQLAHVEALRAAGLAAVPIIVPGNRPGSPLPMLAACQRLSFSAGPVVFDFELGSEPSNAWWDGARVLFRTDGFRAERYGTTAELGLYAPGDDDWIASWIEKGTLATIPQLPAGWHAWQFVNDVSVNGHQYDVSVVDAEFLGGADMSLTSDEHNWLKDVHDGMGSLVSIGPSLPEPMILVLRDKLDQLLGRPAVAALDVAALAADVAKDLGPQLPATVSPADVQAIASAVLQRIGKAATAA